MDKDIDVEFFKNVIDHGRQWFPNFNRRHWHKIDDLLKDFRDNCPFTIKESKLPKKMIGVYVPKKEGTKLGTIILNNDHPIKMHLSTIAHENGHMLPDMYRKLHGIKRKNQSKPMYARCDELFESFEDPEEMVADYMAALGAYPKPTFQKAFCNKSGKIKKIYKIHPLFLFIRASFYLAKYYPELRLQYFTSGYKFYHLCFAIHLMRLRLFLFEKHEL